MLPEQIISNMECNRPSLDHLRLVGQGASKRPQGATARVLSLVHATRRTLKRAAASREPAGRCRDRKRRLADGYITGNRREDAPQSGIVSPSIRGLAEQLVDSTDGHVL